MHVGRGGILTPKAHPVTTHCIIYAIEVHIPSNIKAYI